MKIRLFLPFILFACLFLSCNKDEETLVVIDTIPVPELKVFATINGLILDEEENPINQAKISVNSIKTFSDENGYFSISGNFNPSGTYLKITKEGFFDGKPLVFPHVDAIAQVKIMLIKKEPTTGITSDEIIFEIDKSRVAFAANSFITQNNEPYTGTVSIYGHSLDLFDKNFNYILLEPIQTEREGERFLIQPYGFVNVELYGESGNALNINKNANISIEVPESFRSEAPKEIPLWYLDDADGLWKEEGTAVFDGTQYKGEVSHFSWWCVGLSSNFYTLSGLVTRANNAYSDALVNIKHANGFQNSVRTDNNGKYAINIKTGVEFTIEIIGACGELLESRSMLGNQGDTSLDISMEETMNSRSITGTVLDCNNQPLSNAYVLLYFPDKTYRVILADENGQYQALYEVCGEESIRAMGYDRTRKMLGITLFMGESIHHDIVMCEALSDPEWGVFFTTIDGDTYVINNCEVSVTDSAFAQPEGLLKFTFEYIDRFPNYPDFAGETVIYKEIVNLDPEGVLPALGATDQERIAALSVLSDSPPKVYEFSLKNEIIHTRTTEMVDVSFGATSPTNIRIITRNKNSEIVEIKDTKGVVRMKAKRK